MEDHVDVVDGCGRESEGEPISVEALHIVGAEFAEPQVPYLTDDVQPRHVAIAPSRGRTQGGIDGSEPLVEELAHRDLARINKPRVRLLDQFGGFRFGFAFRSRRGSLLTPLPGHWV